MKSNGSKLLQINLPPIIEKLRML